MPHTYLMSEETGCFFDDLWIHRRHHSTKIPLLILNLAVRNTSV